MVSPASLQLESGLCSSVGRTVHQNHWAAGSIPACNCPRFLLIYEFLETWAYRKEKIRGAETNLPDFSDFARQVPKNFSGDNLFIRPPPPPPPSPKSFGQCTILGVQKFFRHTKIFRNIILIFPML